jgi:molybdenum cofactor synthesis domain-containing protein
MGEILAICLSESKGHRKQPVPRARLVAGFGMEGDAHAGAWHRQISLLAADDIQRMRERGLPGLRFGDFGENLVVRGIEQDALGLGSRIRLGTSAEVRITQRGKVCHTRCAIFRQVGDCIMPTRGLFARVITGGEIQVGDPAEVLERVPPEAFQVVVLTISDTCSRGQAADTAGPGAAALLREELGAHLYAAEIIPDEHAAIAQRLRHYCDGHGVDLVLAVGGTGLAPRDVTPEAVREVVERLTPGFDEAMRAASLRLTPHAMLSRAQSGIRGRTLVLSLPGSAKAAVENLRAVLPALPHGLAKLRGDATPCVPRDAPSEEVTLV